MQTSFSTATLLSVYQFLDNFLLQNGQMYTNTSSQLFYQPDSSLPSAYVAYAAPFKSFVWDSGVSGATIISSISGSVGALSRGTGMIVDFVNGRVLLNSSVGTNAAISGSYSFKDFNLYFANQGSDRMVFTDKYYLNSRFGNPITGIPPAHDMVTPCIFISAVKSKNKELAIGGLYDTSTDIVLNVLAENQGQLENTLSLLATSIDSTFPQLDPYLWPLNSYGDYKSGYNYQTVKNQYGSAANSYWISQVRSAKISDVTKIDEAIFLGEVKLKVERARYIR